MDNKKLIDAVRKRTCIYSKDHHYYKNKIRRAAAWAEISTEVGHPPADCHTRWRAIRDRYARALSKGNVVESLIDPLDEEELEDLSFLKEHIRTKKVPTTPPAMKSTHRVLMEHAYGETVVSEDDDISSDEHLPIETLETFGPVPSKSRQNKADDVVKEEFTSFMNEIKGMATERLKTKPVDSTYLKLLGTKLEELPEHLKETTKIYFLNYVYELIQKNKNTKEYQELD